jgi:hypothetical protein
VKRIYDEAMKAFGKIDILVNNAGTSRAGPFENLTDEIIDPLIHFFSGTGGENGADLLAPIILKSWTALNKVLAIAKTSEFEQMRVGAFRALLSAGKTKAQLLYQVLEGYDAEKSFWVKEQILPHMRHYIDDARLQPLYRDVLLIGRTTLRNIALEHCTLDIDSEHDQIPLRICLNDQKSTPRDISNAMKKCLVFRDKIHADTLEKILKHPNQLNEYFDNLDCALKGLKSKLKLLLEYAKNNSNPLSAREAVLKYLINHCYDRFKDLYTYIYGLRYTEPGFEGGCEDILLFLKVIVGREDLILTHKNYVEKYIDMCEGTGIYSNRSLIHKHKKEILKAAKECMKVLIPAQSTNDNRPKNTPASTTTDSRKDAQIRQKLLSGDELLMQEALNSLPDYDDLSSYSETLVRAFAQSKPESRPMFLKRLRQINEAQWPELESKLDLEAKVLITLDLYSGKEIEVKLSALPTTDKQLYSILLRLFQQFSSLKSNGYYNLLGNLQAALYSLPMLRTQHVKELYALGCSSGTKAFKVEFMKRFKPLTKICDVWLNQELPKQCPPLISPRNLFELESLLLRLGNDSMAEPPQDIRPVNIQSLVSLTQRFFGESVLVFNGDIQDFSDPEVLKQIPHITFGDNNKYCSATAPFVVYFSSKCPENEHPNIQCIVCLPPDYRVSQYAHINKSNSRYYEFSRHRFEGNSPSRSIRKHFVLDYRADQCSSSEHSTVSGYTTFYRAVMCLLYDGPGFQDQEPAPKRIANALCYYLPELAVQNEARGEVAVEVTIMDESAGDVIVVDEAEIKATTVIETAVDTAAEAEFLAAERVPYAPDTEDENTLSQQHSPRI